MNSWQSIQPALREAAKTEKQWRSEALQDAPFDCLGITLLPMTVTQFQILTDLRNPFLVGGIASPAECLQACWYLSDKFTTNTRKRDRFIKRYAWLNYAELYEKLTIYFKQTFLDAPTSKETNKTNMPANALLAYFAQKEFGITFEFCGKVSLRKLLTMLRLARIQKGDTVGNPLQDDVAVAWLRETKNAS
jgi:hypothetical protein